MKKILLVVLFNMLALKCWSQDLATIEYKEIDKYKKAHTTFLVDERDGFIYTLGSNKANPFLAEECKEIYIRKYSSRNFLASKEWVFDNKDLGKSTIYLKKFTVNKNGINVLLEVYRKKEDIKELYVKQISFDGELLKVKKLFTVPSSKKISRRFGYYTSPDSTKTMVYVDINPYVEEEKIPLVFVFDENMELMFQEVPQFSAKEKSVLKPVSIAVSNKGEGFVLAYSGSKKGVQNDGFITNQYAISRMAENEEPRNYKVDKADIKIHGAALGFNKDGNLILNGFYSPQGKEKIEGNLYYLLDHEDLTEITTRLSSFENKLNEKLKHYSGLMYSAFHFYEFSNFMVYPDGIAIVAEQYYQSGSDNNPNSVITKKAYYLIMLDKEGDLKQIVPIEVNQSTTQQLDKYVLTHHKGEIIFLFNDHQDNIERRKSNEEMKDPFGMAVGGMSIQMAAIDAQGNITYQLLMNKEKFGKIPALFTEYTLLNSHDKIFGYITAGMNVLFLTEITLR